MILSRRLALAVLIRAARQEEAVGGRQHPDTLSGMLRRTTFGGIKPEEEKTWYLQILFALSVLVACFGPIGVFIGVWFALALLVLGLVGTVVFLRELLDRSGS